MFEKFIPDFVLEYLTAIFEAFCELLGLDKDNLIDSLKEKFAE